MSDSAEEASNFHRIISLVMDIGTETLRDLFYKEVPRNVVKTLFITPDIINEFTNLRSRDILKQPQWEKLTNNPNPDLYDITLLLILLQNKKICSNIPAPVRGWFQDPTNTDLSVGADLLRLREIRNKIVCHRHNARLQNSEYQDLWCNIKDILLRIAKHVGASEESKIAAMIKDAEGQKVVQDSGKKLETFLDWYRQDSEKYQQQLESVQSSLQSLHLKVDGISQPSDAPDASKEDTVSSLQSQVSSLMEKFSCIAQQDSVIEVKATVQSMGDMVKNILKAVEQMSKMFDENQKNLQELSQQAFSGNQNRCSSDYPDAVRAPSPAHKVKRPKIDNPNAMSEREILDLSKQIGFEWEALRIHLDLTEAQSHALTHAFGSSIQERIYKMLKAWHDVVVECGENPRVLLAAAFVNASQNYAMAYKIVPRDQFDKYASARKQTIDRIQCIEFRKDGFGTGDGNDWSYERTIYERTNTSSQPRHGVVNIYGGEVEFGGKITVHSSTASSSMSHDGRPGSFGEPSLPNAVNVHGGRVKFSETANVALGPPASCYVGPFNPGYSEPFYRGEMQDKPDYSWSLSSFSQASSSGSKSSFDQQSSVRTSGQPFKKDHDNTLSQSMIGALHEHMKSVGVLIHGSETVGTVFRVGSKYVMTALHVVRAIIDPRNTGVSDFSQLENTITCIHFNESAVISAHQLPRFYHVWRNFIFNMELDVAVLEISNPDNGLPKKLFLSKVDFSGSDVSLIGYGNPEDPHKKVLDPRCLVVNPYCTRMHSVLAWLMHNRSGFKAALQNIGENSSLVDLGYHGYDNPSKLIFDCYMEFGASGAPVLTNTNERSVQVVGMLTHGLPEFYFKLPSSAKRDFPNKCRLEVGAKMKDIYEWINASEPGIVQDLFS